MKTIFLNFISISLLSVSVIFGGFMYWATKTTKEVEKELIKTENNMNKQETATFGGGCFWCTEAVFEELEGVTKVESGYSGGKIPNPTYNDISTGFSGHAEVIHIRFNPEKINFSELLDVFFATHNPTTLNRQGADVGTQYRSVVFYHNEKQKVVTEIFINSLEKEQVFDDKIVTQITRFDAFYKAEDHHQDYYKNNKTQGYCSAVINPKLIKFRKKFKEKLKKNK